MKFKGCATKIYKLLIPVYAVLSVAVFLAVCYYSREYSVLGDIFQQCLLSGLIALLGVVFGYVLHTVLHELGHLLAVMGGGVKVIKFGVLFLSVVWTGEKYECRFSFKNRTAGEFVFVAKNPDNAGFFVFRSVLGAMVASFLTLFITILLIKFIDTYVAYCLLGGMASCIIYLVLLNFLSFMPTTDGLLVYANDFVVNDVFAVCSVESYLYKGVRLANMPNDLFEKTESGVNLFYSALKKLYEGDLACAKELFVRLENMWSISADNRLIAVRLQLFYIAIMQHDVDYVAKNENDVLDCLDNFLSPCALRVAIAFRLFKGDVEWAKILSQTFDKMQFGLELGLLSDEKQIIDKLCKTM